MKFCVPRPMAPTDLERRQISAVVARLEAELQPWTDPGEVEVIVGRLFVGFEKGRGSEVGAAVLNREHVEALKGLPLAAIRDAVDRFKTASTLLPWDENWRPTPARVVKEVRAGMIPIRTAILHGRRVLAAEVYDEPTDADRAKVAEMAKNFRENRRGFEDDAEQNRPPAPESVAARDGAFRDVVADLKRFDGDVVLGNLMGSPERAAKSGRGRP